MNERMLKLFQQSLGVNYIPTPIEDHVPLWTEKFAELIVRECIDIVSRKCASPTAYQALVEHFGLD